MLMEALIGLLLVSLVAMGLIYTTTQVERSHTDNKATGLALAQMREMLQRGLINYPMDKDESNDKALTELCDETLDNVLMISSRGDSIKLGLQVSCTQKSLSINGVATETTLVTLKTLSDSTSTGYFGGILQVGNE